MLTAIVTIAIVAILFGMTIFVHELGHFLAARYFGFKVDVFSIGFGPAIWQRTYNGVAYKICIIPLGGYVALPQLDPTGMSLIQGETDSSTKTSDVPESTPTEPARNLPAIAPWKRIIVSIAGAAGNMVFAIFLAWVVYVVGKPASVAEETSIVGYVATSSAAYTNGLRCGDEILAVNGQPVKNWVEFLMTSSRHTLATVTVQRVSEQLTLTLPGAESIGQIDSKGLCMVFNIAPGMSAEKAGFQRGDLLSEFDGQKIYSPGHLVSIMQNYKGKSVPMVYYRDGKRLTTLVTPDYDPATERIRIGIEFNPKQVDVDFNKIVHPSPWTQIHFHSTAIFQTLHALTVPGQASNTAKQIGGPLAILIAYYYVVKLSLMIAVFFTSFLNVNLAIINLLPIPVLDGGHIVFSLWEMIFRRPLHSKIIVGLTNLFAILLIVLFVFLTGRDTYRYTAIGGKINKWMNGKTNVTTVLSEAATNAPPAEPGK
ncbi:MAG: RIP metalloprotease RseP [bacterium]|jgi:regulator of sigma E protease